jgi:hypothetical protein
MSRRTLAADLARVIEADVIPALQEAVAHVEKVPVDILNPDDPNAAVLSVVTVLDGLLHRLSSPEVSGLLSRARAAKE